MSYNVAYPELGLLVSNTNNGSFVVSATAIDKLEKNSRKDKHKFLINFIGFILFLNQYNLNCG